MSAIPPRDLVRFAQMAIIVSGSMSLMGGLIWVIWLVRAYRRDVKRAREGLCMHCGYDLRQSKDRCPECGQPIL